MMRACRRCLCAVYKPSEKAMEAIKHAAETYRLAEAARPKSNKECSAVATGSRRVVSIGDVHGDCCKFLVTLAGAGLIDPTTLEWIAGPNTTLVQTGDLIDRGHQDMSVLDTIMRLQAEAAGSKNGSKVVALLGNHEHMVIGRNTEYMSRNVRGIGWRDEADGPRRQVWQVDSCAAALVHRSAHCFCAWVPRPVFC